MEISGFTNLGFKYGKGKEFVVINSFQWIKFSNDIRLLIKVFPTKIVFLNFFKINHSVDKLLLVSNY